MLHKKRTRQHIIADLCVNHVERHVLLTGYVAQRVAPDYGYDALVFTFDENGEVESGHICLQLKATDLFQVMQRTRTAAVAVELRHLRTWLTEWPPVILVLYDASNDAAYWLDLQGFFLGREDLDDIGLQNTVRVHVPLDQRVNQDAVRKRRELKDRHGMTRGR